MTRRPTFLLIVVLIVLVALTLVACEKERPAPTPSRTTPAPVTTAVSTAQPPSAATQAAPAAAQPTAAATPAAPTPEPVVVTPSGASGSTGGGQAFTYTVAAGDTLATIATKFGTTPEALAQLNNLSDPNALVLGQQLKIVGAAPAGAGATTATGPGGASVYVVVAGDTLGTIAKRFGTTVAQLVELNSLSNPDQIAVGQKLIVSGSGGGSTAPAASAPPATPAHGQKYVIQRGDTLLTIARKFGVTVKQIQETNSITNPDRIYPGQVLVIP